MRSSALSPIAGIEAWPARPSVESLKRNTPFSPTHSVYRRRPSYSTTSPAPSFTTMSHRTFSGTFSHSHRAPIVAPASSSQVAITSSSPEAGRHPERASAHAAATSHATCPFMSRAPRPHT